MRFLIAVVACSVGSRPAVAQAPALDVLDPIFDLSATPPRPPFAAVDT